jgi:MFS family permease
MLVAAAYTILPGCSFGEYAVAKEAFNAPTSYRHRRGEFPTKELAFVLILVGSTAILGRLYDTYGNQFLTDINFPRPCATQPLIAQFPECLLLLLVPFAALPLKYCFVLGPLSWVCVFLGFFACCQLDCHLVIYLSLPFQAGNCIMQTTASIAVDGLFRTSRFRRTAQATLPFVQGTGLLLGSVIAGAVVSYATNSAGRTSWNYVWLIASVAATVATVLATVAMAVLRLDQFREQDLRADPQQPAALTAASNAIFRPRRHPSEAVTTAPCSDS